MQEQEHASASAKQAQTIHGVDHEGEFETAQAVTTMSR